MGFRGAFRLNDHDSPNPSEKVTSRRRFNDVYSMQLILQMLLV